jgi:polysaccharide export outer membrane protein
VKPGWTYGALAALSFLIAQAIVSPASAEDPAAGAAEVPTDSYRIGPGDGLRIFVLGNPDLGAEVPVRPDGKISTPLIPEIVAVGKTPLELAHEMEHRLAQYIRSPNVTVIVSNATSSFSQIRVVGQAITPKALPYRKGLTVLDVLINVGGLSKFAAGNRAKIIRVVDGKSTELKIRLDALINGGDMTQNLEVQPGDIVIIPEAYF